MKKISIIILIAAIFSCSSKSDISKSSVIAWMQGTVTIERSGEVVNANLGLELLKDDVIKTGAKSMVSIQSGTDWVMNVRENSEVLFNNLNIPGERVLYIKNGAVVSKLKKLMKDDSVVVKTPVAIAAVRGTVFSVRYSEDKSSILTVAVSDGKVEVMNFKNEREPIMVNLNKTLEIQKAKPEEPVLRDIAESEKVANAIVDPIPYQNDEVKIIKDSDKKTVDEKINKTIVSEKEAIEKEKKESAKETMPKTLEEIKAKYGRVDEIILYNGKKIKGVILKRGASFTVLTIQGYTKIKATDIKTTSVIM